jgi:hypothetical protein
MYARADGGKYGDIIAINVSLWAKGTGDMFTHCGLGTNFEGNWCGYAQDWENWWEEYWILIDVRLWQEDACPLGIGQSQSPQQPLSRGASE